MEDSKPATRKQNRLALYRQRVKLTQKQVARLIGHADSSMIARYERGASMPPLETALALETLYRTPVAFLYPVLYDSIRARVRHAEEEDRQPADQTSLFQEAKEGGK